MSELDRALVLHPVSAVVGALCVGTGLAAAIHLATPAFAQAAPPDFAAKVVDCYDADTCTLEVVEPGASIFAPISLTHHESARLCDVNAPERKGATLEVAKFARDRLVEWVRAAKVLRFRPALGKDGRARREKYGRLLGWLVADGVVLNDRLVAEGLAVRYIECAP